MEHIVEPRIWLHSSHALSTRDLHPVTILANGGGSLACAFASQMDRSEHPTFESMKGMECHIHDGGFFVFSGVAIQTRQLVVDLYLAEVSHCPVECDLSDAFVIAIRSAPTRLADLTPEPPSEPISVWILVVCGFAFCTRWINTISSQGAIRSFAFVSNCLNPWIGEGAYAKVEVMRAIDGGHDVAVKRMHVDVDKNAIEREMSLLVLTSNHERIVEFLGTYWQFQDTIQLSLVFEIASGDLLQKVVQDGPLSDQACRPIVMGIVAGLLHIHSKGCIHRDIKSENILLKHGLPLIADFGLAAKLTDIVQMSRRCGSPGYVAPEIVQGNPYGTKADVFSLGVVLYFILSLEMPFGKPGDDVTTAMKETVKGELRLNAPPFDSHTNYLRNFLRQLMAKNVAQRLFIDEALVHSWMKRGGKPNTRDLIVANTMVQTRQDEAKRAAVGIGNLSLERPSHGTPTSASSSAQAQEDGASPKHTTGVATREFFFHSSRSGTSSLRLGRLSAALAPKIGGIGPDRPEAQAIGSMSKPSKASSKASPLAQAKEAGDCPAASFGSDAPQAPGIGDAAKGSINLGMPRNNLSKASRSIDGYPSDSCGSEKPNDAEARDVA